MSNAFGIVSKEPLFLSAIRLAFKKVAAQTPLLRMSIRTANDSGKVYFVPMEQPKYEIGQSASVAWEQITEKEMSKKFNEREGPLWRVIFLPKCQMSSASDRDVYPHGGVVIVACHQAIMDDVSMMQLISQVVVELNHPDKPLNRFNNAAYLQPSCDSFTSPVDLMELFRSLRFTLYRHAVRLVPRSIIEARLKKELRNEYIARKGAEIWRNPDVEKSNRIVPIYIPTRTTSLLDVCLKHGVRPQAAVAAAANLALGRMIADGKDFNGISMSNSVMADGKRFTLGEIPKNYIGNFLYVIPKKVHLKPAMLSGPVERDVFWNIARDFHIRIKQHLTRKAFLDAANQSIFFNAQVAKNIPSSYITEHLAGRVSCLILFSNDGHSDLVSEQENRVKVVRWHAATAGVNMGVIFSNTVCVLDNALCWTVRYNTHITSAETADEFCSLAKNILLAITAKER